MWDGEDDPIQKPSNKTETSNCCQRSALRDTAAPKYTTVYLGVLKRTKKKEKKDF